MQTTAIHTLNDAILANIAYRLRQLIAQGAIPADAYDDTLQDLTLAVLRVIPKYDPTRAQWSTFAGGVIEQAIRQLLHQRRTHDATLLPLEDCETLGDMEGRSFSSDAGGMDVGAGDAAANIDLRIDLTTLLQQLPSDLRPLARLLVRGATISDIARRCGTHLTTIYRRLERLKRALAAQGIRPSTQRTPPAIAAEHDAPRLVHRARVQKGALAMPTDSSVCTYSMWQSFKNCRKACEWRYVRELAPITAAKALTFGSLIHDCLHRWHRDHRLDAVLDAIDRACLDRTGNPEITQTWHLATAMMRGYAARYAEEPFTVDALEQSFRMPIRNPESGRVSRTFHLAGKIDGLVLWDGQYYLLEHKTTSTLDGDYLERLWLDQQILLYSLAVQRTRNIRLAGVIYNVLCKARLQQGKGETAAEFDARKAELLAKSKLGKTSAQRKLPESDAEFQQRLQVKYTDPAMFHREVILFTPDQYAECEGELWMLTQQFLDAKRRQAFYRNTTQCFAYGRQCAYYPLCRANGAQHVIDTLYARRPPHEELQPTDAEMASPVF
jgi:RNA polymerase sigma factor (sigma-70 family)